MVRSAVSPSARAIGMPGENQRFCPYCTGANASLAAEIRYVPAGSAVNSKIPDKFVRTDFGLDPAAAGSIVTVARAMGYPVWLSTTVPRSAAPCNVTAPNTRIHARSISRLIESRINPDRAQDRRARRAAAPWRAL